MAPECTRHTARCWPHGNEHAACRALGACDGLINSGRCAGAVCVFEGSHYCQVTLPCASVWQDPPASCAQHTRKLGRRGVLCNCLATGRAMQLHLQR